MTFFGIFGFRPGQLVKGKLGYVINVYFLFTFLLVHFVGIGFLMHINYTSTSVIFLGVFAASMLIKIHIFTLHHV